MSVITSETVTFQDWAKVVHDKYNEMVETADELYVVECPDIFERYLSFFPDGSNPIHKVRTEHDCSTCKQFIRNLGLVVAVRDEACGGFYVDTVWSNWDSLPGGSPQWEVCRQMDKLIDNLPISGIFRSKEKRYGVESNFDSDGNKYHHFHGVVSGKYLTESPDAEKGSARSTFDVFKRGLNDFQLADLSNIIETIEDDEKAIYRGAEHLRTIKGFKEALLGYYQSNRDDLFVWKNVNSNVSHFRNTAIGSLFVDLAKGVDLEVAIKSFEAKVAPHNYKRTSSVITPRMVEAAMQTVADLGLRDALDRRVARIEDVSANDVIWANRCTKSKMKDSLVESLMEAAAKPAGKAGDVKNVKEVSVEDFFASILPTAKDVKVLVENKHTGNFLTLTAPVDREAGRLFKWGNGFTWSYDGDVTDSMRDAVVAAGGRVDGALRFTHQWNHVGRNASLMDLHVFLPGCKHVDGKHDVYPFGPRVGWSRRQDLGTKGSQDVDYVQAAPEGFVPVENITFPDGRRLPDGVYTFAIHNWQLRHPTTSGFRAEIEFDGKIYQYDHPEPLAHKQWITLAKLYRKDGRFTDIEHVHPLASSIGREKWGIKTEAFSEVETIMLSPNHWDDSNGAGNRHYIFILKGCSNPEPVRGIYNEFLRSDLEPHRKVFEILGSKTKADPDANGLSGLGFSSTKKAELVSVVDGRPYRIQF